MRGGGQRGRLAALAVCAAILTGASQASAAGPSDPLASQQQPLALMHVPAAVNAAGKLRGVRVMVADTGIDLDHPDLRNRLFTFATATLAPVSPFGPQGPFTIAAGGHGWDMIGQTNGCAPGPEAPDALAQDPAGCSGHGTAVAGFLGAEWNNGVGGAGVAPNARFVAMRSCWDGDQCYDHIQPPAFDWAADHGVRVVTMSWLSGANPALNEAIAQHPRTLFVAIPSGNGGAYDADGANPQPCAVPLANLVCVSVSSPSGGIDCAAFGRRVVDVAVPTTNSRTTVNGGGFGGSSCATSFASPTLGGLAAILFGMEPRAGGAEVRNVIIASAARNGAWSGKSVSGGVANALAAVRLMQRRWGLGPFGRCFGIRATIRGTPRADRIRGTRRRDVIKGLGGADRIKGRGGPDLLCGGPGRDVLRGGPGRDRQRQ